MKYRATLNGRGHSVEVKEVKPGLFEVLLDDRRFVVDAARLTANSFSMLAAGESFDVDFTSRNDHVRVLVRGVEFDVEVMEERRYRLLSGERGQQTEGGQIIRAPMPGKVVKLLVERGNEVKAGQGVVVVEAMKMENELRAVAKGKVKEILIKEGQTVEAGANLVAFE